MAMSNPQQGEDEPMTSMRLALLLVVTVLGSVACTESTEQEPDAGQRSDVDIQFRLAETEQAPDLTAMRAEGTDETYYVHGDVILSAADVASASVQSFQGRPNIEIVLTEPARVRWAEFTGTQIGRRVAIIVDGRLVSAPVIRAAITQGKAVITGDFTPEEARRIAAGLAGK